MMNYIKKHVIVTNYTIGHSANNRINSLFTDVIMKLPPCHGAPKGDGCFLRGNPKKMSTYPPSLRKHGNHHGNWKPSCSL